MCNILVVDDDPDIAYTFCEASADVSEIQCWPVHTIQEAKYALASERIGIVVLDMRLRGESGHDLASYVSANYPDIIIVAFTGYPDTIRSMELCRYIDDYIYKPISLAEISDRVITWMISYNHKQRINAELARIREECQEALASARGVRQRVAEILGETLHG